MPRIRYVDWRPSAKSIQIVKQANEILAEYARQGYDLTLRQLYYQFVARDLLPNKQASYDMLGQVVSQARDAGLIDWDQIKDRGRSLRGLPHWTDGNDFIQSVAGQYHHDLWLGQPTRVQVWVEKDALSGIVARAANAWDCTYFANKGYVSASSIWEAAQGMLNATNGDTGIRRWVVLHLGDHDPSGLDMTRDVEERLSLYATPWRDGYVRPQVEVRRIALNMDQVQQYNPPPNPAKVTDSRFKAYQEEYGDESWELDALEPSVLVDLIGEHIKAEITNWHAFGERRRAQTATRAQLAELRLPPTPTKDGSEADGEGDNGPA